MTSFGHGQLCELSPWSKDLWPRQGLWLCMLCDLGNITLDQGHDTPLGHGQQLCEILSRSNKAVGSCVARTDFCYVYTVTMILEIWPWFKVTTPLGHWQYLCEILSRSKMAVCRYGPDTDFGYVCTVTLEIWPWAMNKLYVIIQSTRQWGIMADTDFGYVCTVTFTLTQGQDKLLGVMEHNCVKHCPDL